MIAFIRHGESTANKEGWLAGHQDVPLTPLGISQATQLQADLAPLSFGAIYTSNLIRAQHTATIALEGLAHQAIPTPHLRERDLGEWEGDDLKSVRADGRMNVLLSWTGRPPGGESQQDVARRVVQWLCRTAPPSPTLLIAHGGVIRILLGLIHNTDHEHIGMTKVPNGELITVNTHPIQWRDILMRISPSQIE